jgi:Nucleosome binding factor SPN, SPT16 subunit
MSTDPEAKLFYGYVKPIKDDDDFDELGDDASENEEDDESDEEGYDDYEETPWSKAHTISVHGCIGGIHGYDENLGYFLAVEESLHTAEWDEVKPLTAKDFKVKAEWDKALNKAAAEFGIDLTGLEPGLYLVCLYL